jgi:outer membrane scaffolding protein for murein synthesis (MipA/OmpV family)
VKVITAIALFVLLAGSKPAVAEGLLDWLRGYDMNDYSLGVAVSTRQSPFIGGENSLFAYPYLTSFTHDSMTDDWFLIRDGGYGIRWISDNDWELGAIARIRTLGLGNSQAEELVGIADRKWAIELGPTVGYRGWPIHINWTHWTEVTDRHGGFTSSVAFSYPMQFDWGFVVPRIDAIYENSEHTNYYYSVSEAEATPTRPAYTPGSTWSSEAQVRLGYAIANKWLLTATVGVQMLGSEITDSPIVGRDHIWFGNLGLAYNADVFNPTAFDNYDRQLPTFDIRVGAFFVKTNSKLTRDTVDGVPGFEVDLEDILEAPDEETAIEVDAIWRIGEHHRLELGYFELVRDAATTLQNDLEFGDQVFPAGTEISSRINYSSLRFGYTFYLMRDSQKELGIMGGVHLTELDTRIVTVDTPQIERSKSSTPLPVIGLNGAVFFGEKTTLRARIHIFRTDFDQHEGSLNYAALDLERRFGSSITAGIGYNFYGVKLSSRDDSLNGNLNIRHHGPVLFMTAGF